MSLYKLLGIGNDASQEEIRKAYKVQARKWHPDKHPEDTKKAEEHFKSISYAYEILSDPSKKRDYDNKVKFGFDSGEQSAREGKSPSGGFEGFEGFSFPQDFSSFKVPQSAYSLAQAFKLYNEIFRDFNDEPVPSHQRNLFHFIWPLILTILAFLILNIMGQPRQAFTALVVGGGCSFANYKSGGKTASRLISDPTAAKKIFHSIRRERSPESDEEE